MWASGVKASAGDPVAVGFDSKFSVGNNVAISVDDDVWTKMTWRLLNYDILDEFDMDVNERFTAQSDGYYHFDASAGLTNLNAGEIFKIRLTVNGAFSQELAGDGQQNAADTGTYTVTNTSGDVYLEAGDYVEVEVYQTLSPAEMIGQANTVFSGHRFA